MEREVGGEVRGWPGGGQLVQSPEIPGKTVVFTLQKHPLEGFELMVGMWSD